MTEEQQGSQNSLRKTQLIKGFTLKGRPKVSCLLAGNDLSVPALGTYDPKIQMNALGKYPLANYRNTKQVTFGQKTDQVMYKRLSQPCLIGPGSYEIKYRNQSIIKRERSPIFDISKRKSIADVARDKLTMPGPGFYKVLSEFGELPKLDKSQSKDNSVLERKSILRDSKQTKD
ncbi:hypothetical protein FGO68_gene8225 [Halteria grandinella]|uniref:Uncharacterized protein n=1 Tax=Halteria grandinella TaxID=5974 RepID=A0A8J8NNA0_HALGN|nr:hypothetical protein FGO68_gene8225 [Halteria grandinella]